MAKTKQTDLFDVAVIGGGPAGRIAALSCAAAGLKTLLLAPLSGKEDGRTTALWQDSIAQLSALGVWEKLEGRVQTLRKMRMVDDTGRLFRAPEVMFDSAELGLESFGFNILNSDLNKVLQECTAKAANITDLETGLQDLVLQEDVALLKTAGGDSYRARLVVAADGRNSLARQCAGIEVRRWTYPQVAVVLNLDHSKPHNDISTEFHTRTGPFTLVPLPGRGSSLVCVETKEGADRLIAMDHESLALELEQRSHSILGKFTVATEPQSFPLSGMTARRLVATRLALIGETAHVFPPVGAQGLNLSMRDIADLARVLAEAKARQQDIGAASVLANYERKRRGDIRERTGAVDALNRSLLTDFLPVQVARSTGMYLAGKVGPFRRFLMREGIAPQAGIPFLR